MEKIPSIDSVFVLLATAAVGKLLGPTLGIYMLIVFGWFCGAIIGVFRIEDGTRIKTAWFLVVTFGGTVGGAAIAANLLSSKFSGPPSDWLFCVAIAIPAIGTDWLRVGRWLGSHAWRKAKRIFEALRE